MLPYLKRMMHAPRALAWPWGPESHIHCVAVDDINTTYLESSLSSASSGRVK